MSNGNCCCFGTETVLAVLTQLTFETKQHAKISTVEFLIYMYFSPTKKYLIGFIICSDIKGSRKTSFQDKNSRSLYVQLQKKVSEENNIEILGPSPFCF